MTRLVTTHQHNLTGGRVAGPPHTARQPVRTTAALPLLLLLTLASDSLPWLVITTTTTRTLQQLHLATALARHDACGRGEPGLTQISALVKHARVAHLRVV